MSAASRRDLPGQAVMFPELEPAAEQDREPRAAREEGEPAALGLPNKATCTVGEAHQYTGISVRQLRYWVDDGTLLAVNAARVPVSQCGEERGGARRSGKLDRWRIVVRRTAVFEQADYRHFQTLEEFIRSRTNKEN